MKKASFYNLYFTDSNQSYVFNTLTSALIKIPSEVADFLSANNLNEIPDEMCASLSQRGIVVDSSMDESRYFEYYYNLRQYGHGEELFVVILPTYSCNLRCTYCYQGKNAKTGHMGEKETHAVLQFIKTQIEQNKRVLKSLKVVFFGGEPLVCKELVIQMANEIRQIANKSGLAFYSSIITNATLVDQDVIDRLIRPNSMTLQVSIDGNRISHDKKRIDACGNGTYDIILSALKRIAKSGLARNVILRINIDKTNCSDIESVLQEFSSVVGRFYFGRLRPDGSYGCNAELCMTIDEYQTNCLPKIRLLASKYPIDRSGRQFGKMHPCGFNKRSVYIVDPFLDVYKCDGLVGIAKFSVGKISCDGQLLKNDNYFLQATWSPFRHSKCMQCKWLPICAGGCPYNGYLKTHNVDVPYCGITEELVVKDLLAMVRGETQSIAQDIM